MSLPTDKLSKQLTRRAFLLCGLQLGFGGVLAARLRHLQVEQANQFRLMADENRINVRLISPKRGEIYDRNGVILARNEQSFRITLVEEETDDVKDVLDKLSQLILITPDDVQQIIEEFLNII